MVVVSSCRDQIHIAFGGGGKLHQLVEIKIVNLQIGHDFQTPFKRHSGARNMVLLPALLLYTDISRLSTSKNTEL